MSVRVRFNAQLFPKQYLWVTVMVLLCRCLPLSVPAWRGGLDPLRGVLQGTSRGGANIKEIVRRIDLWGLDMVFVVGGNGGNAAADAIQREVEKQGVRCVVAGVPKSIDNDILLVSGWAGLHHGVSWGKVTGGCLRGRCTALSAPAAGAPAAVLIVLMTVHVGLVGML